MNLPVVYLFSDGACSGNPGTGGWATVLWTGAPDLRKAPARLGRDELLRVAGFRGSLGQVVELSGAISQTTNNRMEITAILKGFLHLLSLIKSHRSEGSHSPSSAPRYTSGAAQGVAKDYLFVLSDSKYVISGLTDWIRGWRVRGWLTKEGEPVSNRDLWEQLAEAHEALAKFYYIQFCHVEGHVGQPGNERCDALAVGEANHQPLQLFCVDFKEYPFELQQGLGPLMRGEREEKFSDPYYLSYIDGELQRHSTWKECEMRIKGRRGAKFKKITRPSEERSILESWGLSLLQKS